MENNYFSFDTINGDYEFHETEREAKKEAEKALDFYKDEAADDGWPDDMSKVIGYGKLIAVTHELWNHKKEDFTEEEWDEFGYNSDFDIVSDYELKEVQNET